MSCKNKDDFLDVKVILIRWSLTSVIKKCLEGHFIKIVVEISVLEQSQIVHEFTFSGLPYLW